MCLALILAIGGPYQGRNTGMSDTEMGSKVGASDCSRGCVFVAEGWEAVYRSLPPTPSWVKYLPGDIQVHLDTVFGRNP